MTAFSLFSFIAGMLPPSRLSLFVTDDSAFGPLPVATSAFETLLINNQIRKDCSTRRFAVFTFEGNYYGFGSQFHVLAAAFRYALKNDRTLVIAKYDYWNHQPKIPDAFHHYFYSATNCKASSYWQSHRKYVIWDVQKQSKKITSLTSSLTSSLFLAEGREETERVVWLRVFKGGSFDYFTKSGLDRWVPDITYPTGLGSDQQKIHVWVQSQIVNFLFRPRPSLLQEIEAAKERMQLDKYTDVTGVAVRGNEKLSDNFKDKQIFGVDDIFNSALQSENVLLISEIPDLISQVQTSYNIIWDKTATRINSGHADPKPDECELRGENCFSWKTGRTEVDYDSLVKHIIIDLALLANCKYLVIQLNSMFHKLAFELWAGRSDNIVNLDRMKSMAGSYDDWFSKIRSLT